MKLYLYPNNRKESQIQFAVEALEKMESAGYQCFLSKKMVDRLCLSDNYIGSAESCDVVVSLGGDGVALRAAKIAIEADKPLLGINGGVLGYLCAAKLDNIHAGFIENLKTSSRSLLEFNAEGNTHQALNDVVIFKTNMATTVRLNVTCSHHSYSFKGDGLVISTPTGSTSYNLSAGGPIVDEDALVNIVTPLCPHDTSIKPIVVPDHTIVEVSDFAGYDDGAIICADGAEIGKLKGTLQIKTSSKKLNIYVKE